MKDDISDGGHETCPMRLTFVQMDIRTTTNRRREEKPPTDTLLYKPLPYRTLPTITTKQIRLFEMEDAQLYATSNAFQKRDAAIVLSSFVPSMNWSNDDVILDVGSGSGDVTRNLLLPLCPNFRQIIGIDSSSEMVNYATDHFTHDKLSFFKMDIAETTQPINIFPDAFTKIFSFYCLHWIKKQNKALNNLYQLLRPGGSCLLVFIARHPIFDVYERVAKNQRWAPYMKDVDKYIPVHQTSTDAAKDFRDSLENCGFRVDACEAPEFTFVFENLNYLRNAMKAVNPFIHRMPQEEQNDYLIDCIEELRRMKTPLVDGKMAAIYNLLVAHAHK